MRHISMYTSFLALVLSTELWAQEGIEQQNRNVQYAPSPKAAEMIRYGHLSSNLNGGTMEYDIPIYTLEDKDCLVPNGCTIYMIRGTAWCSLRMAICVKMGNGCSI